MSLYAVILAGGTGTRLWPYSRRSRPKQLLPLVDDGSLLQATVARLAPLVPPERVLVISGAEHVAEVRRQLPGVPRDNLVAEPQALGTAAAIGLGAALVGARDREGAMVVLPADHVIRPAERFRADVERAAVAAADGRLVTFGIVPSGPETGYGYIELGEDLPGPSGARAVVRFVEKPDLDTARAYLAGGRHVWNSGMFAWTVPTIVSALRTHLPGLADAVAAIASEARRATLTPERLDGIYGRIEERTTIDYGVMEQSDRVACIPATFEWNDVGSWSALGDVLSRDGGGNAVRGDHLGLDTRDCIIVAEGGRLVATVGVEGLVIVDTGDAVLVCPRDRAQDVRAIVRLLEEDGRDDRL